jgi:hypothetical protein
LVARILADDEDRLGFLEVPQGNGTLADSDRFRERESARLVTHVRAIRQVIGAELSDEKLIDEGGFVAGPA